jgi:hypothetical protein
MKVVILVCLMLLAFVIPAAADIVTVLDGWTVVYHITGEPTTRFFGDGTYLFLSTGSTVVVYLQHDGAWRFQGYQAEVVLPADFPQITVDAGGLPTQVVVIPPPPPPPVPLSSCGTRPLLAKASVVVVGGLPEDAEVIGPFPTPALANRFAQRQCHGTYSIEPLHR